MFIRKQPTEKRLSEFQCSRLRSPRRAAPRGLLCISAFANDLCSRQTGRPDWLRRLVGRSRSQPVTPLNFNVDSPLKQTFTPLHSRSPVCLGGAREMRFRPRRLE